MLVNVFRTVSLLVLLCGLAACEAVPAYQRGDLARTEMAFDPDPLESRLNQHIYFSKEASTGGNGVAAGGCKRLGVVGHLAAQGSGAIAGGQVTFKEPTP